MRLHSLPSLLIGIVLVLASTRVADDWPMWRCDAWRTAASEEKLPAKIQLEWERRYAPREQVWDDPLNHDLMSYDKVFEPVVMGDRMFIGFNDSDKGARHQGFPMAPILEIPARSCMRASL